MNPAIKNAVATTKTADMVFVEEINNTKEPTKNLIELFVGSKSKWDSLLSGEQKNIFYKFIARAERLDYYNLPPLILSRTIVGIYLLIFANILLPNWKKHLITL